jgi:hypothetical protein
MTFQIDRDIRFKRAAKPGQAPAPTLEEASKQ